MSNPVIYILLNGEQNMSPGKSSAQAVHAAMCLENEYKGRFVNSNKRTVIVLEADYESQLRNLHEYLKGEDVFSAYYIDEGHNEVDPYSITALAVAPIDSDDEEKRSIFEKFRLYSGPRDEDVAIKALGYEVSWDDRPKFIKQTLEWLKKKYGGEK